MTDLIVDVGRIVDRGKHFLDQHVAQSANGRSRKHPLSGVTTAMIDLYNAETHQLIGAISERELRTLEHAFERNPYDPCCAFIDRATIDLLPCRRATDRLFGLPRATDHLLQLLRAAIADSDGVKISWQPHGRVLEAAAGDASVRLDAEALMSQAERQQRALMAAVWTPKSTRASVMALASLIVFTVVFFVLESRGHAMAAVVVFALLLGWVTFVGTPTIAESMTEPVEACLTIVFVVAGIGVALYAAHLGVPAMPALGLFQVAILPRILWKYLRATVAMVRGRQHATLGVWIVGIVVVVGSVLAWGMIVLMLSDAMHRRTSAIVGQDAPGRMPR